MRRILTLVASLARFRTAASPMLLLGVLFLGQGLLANNAHAWSWPSCRNYNGSSPEQPSTIYLGDTGTFGCDSWGTVDGHWGKHQVFIDQDNLIADGSSGSWSSHDNADHNQGTSPQFTAVGTWYWGMKVEYTDAGGTTGWYCRDNSSWDSMYGTPDSDLTITVSALGDPTSASASTGAGTPTTEIDLSWGQWSSRNVMIIRRKGSAVAFTPVQGTLYSDGQDLGSDTIVLKRSQGGVALTDTGLESDTTYHYKFYSENFNYFSVGTTTSATTDAAPQPAVTHGPATLTYEVIRGALPPTQSFAVTNSGGGILAYTNTLSYGAGATGWLTVSRDDSTLATSLSESTVVSVVTSNLTQGIYYATNTITGNQANGTKTVAVQLTVNDPDDPTVSSGAVDVTHPATRIDLSWAKNGSGHDVMIVRSDDASFTAPSDGVVYNDTQSIGGDPVIFKGSATTPIENTGLLEGTMYYYKFYSEHYGYYSAGAVTNVTTGIAQTRNTSGTDVEDPSVTVYLGDTHVFGCDSWASLDGAFGKWRVVIDQDADLSDGSAGSYIGHLEVEHKTNTSARFTDTGTWYWGMQVEYGGTHGDAHWYVSDNGSWGDMATTPTSSLTVDVQALPLVTGQSATTNTVNPTNEVDLAWTPTATPTTGNYQVMIVRKAGSAPSAPAQGTTYSVNDSCGGGTVIYKGFASSFTDTSLSAGTAYHYAFYSENFSYYAASAAASETTAGSGGPFVPTGTIFKFQ